MLRVLLLHARLTKHPQRFGVFLDEVVHEHGSDVAVRLVGSFFEAAHLLVDIGEVLLDFGEDLVRGHEAGLRFLNLRGCEEVLEGRQRLVVDLQQALGDGVDVFAHAVVVAFQLRVNGEEVGTLDVPVVVLKFVIFDDEVGKKLVQHLVHEKSSFAI